MTTVSAGSALRRQLDEVRSELEGSRAALQRMSEVGMALMGERDPHHLYPLILTQARALTSSDAATLYVVETDGEGLRLRFETDQNATLPDLPPPTFTLAFDETSIAGYAATTGEPVVLDDVYDLPEDVPFSFNPVYDQEYGYRAKSMLTVPMIDHGGKVVGVLQLINRKREPEAEIRTDEDAARCVLPYTEGEVEVVRALAGQAAVAIENGLLYQQIEDLFDRFIEAAVTAIEYRDPTTQGHSRRVTELTCETAQLISRQTEGPFAGERFDEARMKQLRYSGLLHDFGKVAVREATLVKEKKLPPVLYAQVEARFDLIRRSLELGAWKARASVIAEGGVEGAADAIAEIDGRLVEDMERVERYWSAVSEANVPRVLDEDAAEILDEIAGSSFEADDGSHRPYITSDELDYLRIKRGSLTQDELREIQSHVVHSYNFLQGMPWTDDLSRIAEIVRGHHEKLDGSGYPDGVTGDQLCLETRIMTVCDIFDALTASDRPYKQAMSVEKALEILQWEARDGMLDSDIVELFAESKVYEKVLDRDWTEL
jgi:HD-GYP domain-containing protein (c-di-GMP phosphodiesterase class II)